MLTDRRTVRRQIRKHNAFAISYAWRKNECTDKRCQCDSALAISFIYDNTNKTFDNNARTVQFTQDDIKQTISDLSTNTSGFCEVKCSSTCTKSSSSRHNLSCNILIEKLSKYALVNAKFPHSNIVCSKILLNIR